MTERTDVVPARLSRRGFVVGSTAVCGLGLLAACSGADGGAGAGGGSGGTPDVQGRPDGTLLPLDDVPVGGAVAVRTSGGEHLLVARPDEGSVVAFSAVCTHMGCIVEPDPDATGELHCPCHGSVYRTATGENVSGPAPRPLAPVEVEVRDGDVVEA